MKFYSKSVIPKEYIEENSDCDKRKDEFIKWSDEE